VLRGLTLNGVGGTNGISMTAGANLHVENCVVAGFSDFPGAGIDVPSSAGASARLFVKDTICRRNYYGIKVGAGSGSLDHVRLEQNVSISLDVFNGGTKVSIANSVASGNLYGLFADASAELNIEACLVANNSNAGIASDIFAVVRVSNSTVTNNGTGLSNGLATLESRGNNTVRGNTTNTSGTITVILGT